MIFKDLFTDAEISTLSVMVEAISTIKSEEEFNEYVQLIADTLDDMNKESVARYLILGTIMAGFMVQQMEEDASRALNN